MGSARLERRARLAKKSDFRYVFECPERSRDHYFTVLARCNSLGFPRLGLAVSRKSVRSAVVRNRIKRVIRESFRLHQQALSGIDFVVIARDDLTREVNAVLADSLERHWQRLIRQCVRR